MTTYALDTNTLINLIRGNTSVISRYGESLAKKIPIIIPPYVDFEILRGFKYANATGKEKIYQRLCNNCKIGEMRRDMWIKAADLYSDLRHKGFTVGDADILIAAFCIETGCTLVPCKV